MLEEGREGGWQGQARGVLPNFCIPQVTSLLAISVPQTSMHEAAAQPGASAKRAGREAKATTCDRNTS